MSSPYPSNTFVLEAIDKACATVAQWQREELSGALLYRNCESALEAAWRVWWNVVTTHCNRRGPAQHVPHALYQHEIQADGRNYRLDVAIVDWQPSGARVPLIAVELDGHTYHERTPEQVAERNARDRALQVAGWTVLHFSYSEIKDKGLDCAIEVLERFDALVDADKRRSA